MKNLTIVKIGGQILDDADLFSEFVQLFSQLKGEKILVHGGGKLVTDMAKQLGISTQLIDGRRITDAASLKLATMVYAGYLNKNLVAQLQAHHCDALGLSGTDAGIIQTQKRATTPIDFGYVGDLTVTSVHTKRIQDFLELGLCPVFSAITHDGQGQLLNTNADSIASALAISLSSLYNVNLIYCFDKKGVLQEVSDEKSLIEVVKFSEKEQLIAAGMIVQGMLPKMDNAWSALQQGVKSVTIKKSSDLLNLNTGTSIQL